jgi:acyl carrier protein
VTEARDPNVERLVLDIVAAIAERPASTIFPQTALFAELGLDSASALQLLVELEDTFNIVIDSADASRLRTVGDVLDYLNRRGIKAL